MKTFTSLFLEAWRALRFHVRRSVLTTLGIAWGIATVVILLAYGAGFEKSVVDAFQAFGAKVIFVSGGRTSQQAGGEKAGKWIRLQKEDMEFIQETVPLVKSVSPQMAGRYKLSYGARTQEFEVIGVYPVYGRMRSMTAGEGRWLNDADELEHARVAVIGAEVKKRLFSERPAAGETLRIGGMSFGVAGVLAKKVSIDDSEDNRTVFIPFSALTLLQDTRYPNTLCVEVESAGAHTRVVNDIRARLGERLGFRPSDKRALRVFDIEEELDEVRIITGALKVLLAAVGALTLAIGGVGVMNIMLVSVMQRTREIGTQKSLGARQRHILTQFLSEALLITFLGGAVGVLMAYVITWILGPLPLWSAIYGPEGKEGDIVLRITWQTLAAATGILSAVGLAAGLWPAVRAARLNPVEALRYE